MAHELRRALSLPATVFYGVGQILGAGIYSIAEPAVSVPPAHPPGKAVRFRRTSSALPLRQVREGAGDIRRLPN